jgi:hypothetical protein
MSERFCQAGLTILDGKAVVSGTVVQRSNTFADQVKAQARVMVKPVTLANRMRIAPQIYAELVRHLARGEA